MRRLLLTMMVMLSLTAFAQRNIYKFTATDASGNTVSMKQFKGKVLLIVNTATKCGFTPQYTELEKLYEECRDQGFEILDFPCNQFGAQAPGSIQEIRAFCTGNYNTQFPQFDKIEVNGDGAHPLFVYLKKQQAFGGFDTNERLGKVLDSMMSKQDANYQKNPDIKWNFTKFLIDRKGRVVKRFEPTDKMSDVAAAVRALLKK